MSRVPDLEQTELVEGYDFVNDRINASDDNGHGTHVAGTVAQSTNNNYGVAGIAYEAKIMPLKVLSEAEVGQYPISPKPFALQQITALILLI